MLCGCKTCYLTLKTIEVYREWKNGAERKTEQVCRKLNDECHNLYFSTNATRIIKSRRMRLVDWVERTRGIIIIIIIIINSHKNRQVKNI
jgi:hypothetical protein